MHCSGLPAVTSPMITVLDIGDFLLNSIKNNKNPKIDFIFVVFFFRKNKNNAPDTFMNLFFSSNNALFPQLGIL